MFNFSSLFRLHHNYIYHPSYLPTAAGLLPVTPSALNPTAAALSAAGQQAYFDYTSAAAAAASYPATYQTAAAAATGIEPYAAAAAVSAGELQAGRAAAAHQGGARDTHEHGWGRRTDLSSWQSFVFKYFLPVHNFDYPLYY